MKQPIQQHSQPAIIKSWCTERFYQLTKFPAHLTVHHKVETAHTPASDNYWCLIKNTIYMQLWMTLLARIMFFIDLKRSNGVFQPTSYENHYGTMSRFKH